MKKVLFFAIGLILISSLVIGQDYSYVGAKKCKMCHKGEKKGKVWEKWEAGPHAKAFKTLEAKGEHKNPKCLECHVTAFNKGGYKVGDANAAKFAWVGCESCHGPGSKYKKKSIMKDQKQALANGMVIPDEKVCTKCHNKKSPTFKGFDFKKWSAKVNHTYKK